MASCNDWTDSVGAHSELARYSGLHAGVARCREAGTFLAERTSRFISILFVSPFLGICFGAIGSQPRDAFMKPSSIYFPLSLDDF